MKEHYKAREMNYKFMINRTNLTKVMWSERSQRTGDTSCESLMTGKMNLRNQKSGKRKQ